MINMRLGIPAKKNRGSKSVNWEGDCLFVRSMQKQLLQKALAPWPRREAPLLEINCGDGAFLRLYWQSGFDIVATEKDPGLLEAAKKRQLSFVDLRIADEEALPFEDDNFDWVILNVRQTAPERLDAALREALRVGKRGIMITFWNALSIAGIWARLRGRKSAFPVQTVAWPRLFSLIRPYFHGKTALYSTLCLPDFTWRAGFPGSGINGFLGGSIFGAWCLLRFEPGSGNLVTPLPLRLKEQFQQSDAVLKYVQKQD